MEQNKLKRRVRIALYIVGLIIFLELSSALVLNNVVSAERMERFNNIFLRELEEWAWLPHPYLGWVEPKYLEEQERYLSLLGENRTDKIYIACLGGSTTWTGYPKFTERYLNRQLESANLSLRAMVFNFGVRGWRSDNSLQNYVYVVRYLHPDFVVIHHNVNEIVAWNSTGHQPFRQSVLYYPRISHGERTLLRNSRFCRVLKFAYLVSYNQLRYGRKVVLSDRVDLPTQARLSSLLNEEGFDEGRFFRYDFTGGRVQLPEIPLEFLLTENYESLIKYTRADNTTLIITTQYIDGPGFFRFNDWSVEKGQQLQEESEDINELLRDISAKHGVALVDLDREMEQYDYLLLEDRVHWTEEGIRLKGELVGEAIFEMLKERYNLSG